MAKILSIECGTAVCSVALGDDGELLSLLEDSTRNHASTLAPFIDQILEANDIKPSELDAIAIAQGPGSYTGLRIGAATAKALAYALNIPLIAIPSLKSLSNLAVEEYNVGLLQVVNPDTVMLVPMIDARRMEVFTANYNMKLDNLKQTHALIVDAESFKDENEQHDILLFGDGAKKCYDVLSQESSRFIYADITASARGMVTIAQEMFLNKEFVSTAYWEPNYLKDFVVTQSKKKLL